MLVKMSSWWRILPAAEDAVTSGVTPSRVFRGGGCAAVGESLAEGAAAPGASAPPTTATRAAPRRHCTAVHCRYSGNVNLHSVKAGHSPRAPGAHLALLPCWMSPVVFIPLVERGHWPGGGQRPGDGDSQPRHSTHPIPVVGGVQHHVWLGWSPLSSLSSLPLVLRLQRGVAVTGLSCRLSSTLAVPPASCTAGSAARAVSPSTAAHDVTLASVLSCTHSATQPTTVSQQSHLQWSSSSGRPRS